MAYRSAIEMLEILKTMDDRKLNYCCPSCMEVSRVSVMHSFVNVEDKEGEVNEKMPTIVVCCNNCGNVRQYSTQLLEEGSPDNIPFNYGTEKTLDECIERIQKAKKKIEERVLRKLIEGDEYERGTMSKAEREDVESSYFLKRDSGEWRLLSLCN